MDSNAYTYTGYTIRSIIEKRCMPLMMKVNKLPKSICLLQSLS